MDIKDQILKVVVWRLTRPKLS